jgi:hypothetical protein
MRPLRNLSKQVAASLNMRKGPPRLRLRSGTRPNVHGADDSGDSRFPFSGPRSDESRPARALACSYALHPRDAHQPSVPGRLPRCVSRFSPCSGLECAKCPWTSCCSQEDHRGFSPVVQIQDSIGCKEMHYAIFMDEHAQVWGFWVVLQYDD